MHRPFSNAPSFVRETEHGVLQMWIDRPGWLLSRMSGRFELLHCATMLSAGDDALRMAPRLRFVHDWRAMTGFDAGVPPHLVGWAARHARQVEHSTIVCSSGVVAMAARAANVTLRNLIHVTTDPSALELTLTPW